MKDKLSYPAQRCVLEHFEANKRLLLASRCPSIKSVDKSIPLKIRYLSFSDQAIHINNIIYKFEFKNVYLEETVAQKITRQSKALEPGEILMEYDLRSFHDTFMQLTFKSKINSVTEIKRMPANFKNVPMVMRLFAKILLQHRQGLKISTLDFYLISQKIVRIPEGIKFHTKHINIYRHNLDLIRDIIDPKCLPLKTIFFTAWRESYYKNQIILNCKMLTLKSTPNKRNQYWHPVLLKLPNKFVEMSDLKFSGKEIREIVRNVMEKGRKIGSSFILECSGGRVLTRLMEKIKKRFNGKEVTLKRGIGNLTVVSKIISIPLTTKSELVVYGYTRNWETDNKIRILLKVLASGNTIAVEKKVMGFRIPWIFGK